MKKTFFSLLAAATFFVGCKADKAVDLKFRLPQGEAIEYVADMKQTINQTVMGNAMSVQQDVLFGMRYTVIAMEGENRVVEVSYNRIKMATDAAGQQIKFDSKDTSGNAPALAILSGMIGKTFRMTVSPIGEVLKVEGFQELLNSMAGDPSDPATANYRQQLGQMFSDESIKQTLSQNTNIYPEKPVKPGDTWKKTHNSSMGPISLQIENTYKLESATDKTAKVSMNATITGKNTGGPDAIQGMTVDMKGTQSGTLNVDIPTGILEKMDLTQDIDGGMEMQGMKVPMKIKTIGTISGKQVK